MTFEPDKVQIADGLIRVAQVLGATIQSAAGLNGLSQLQLGILEVLAKRSEGMPVSDLARRFMISAATVSDSLRVLDAKGYVTKSRGSTDGRSVTVKITESGREVGATAMIWVEKLRRIIGEWDETRRAHVLPALISLIDGMQKEGMIPLDRMCVACRYFAINCDPAADAAQYYCRFIGAPLADNDLRVDCPDFARQPSR